MKKLTLAVLVSALVFTSGQATARGDKSYKDSDWNVAMWAWDNAYLHGQDIKWVNYNGDKALQFTLEGGKPGLAADDKQKSWGPKFAERNELHSEYFNQDPPTIEFKFNIVKGFRDRRETFFQVHSYNDNCTEARPPLMIQLHKGRLRVQTIVSTAYGDHKMTPLVSTNYNGPVNRRILLKKWHDMRITSHQVGKNYVQYIIQSESLGISKVLPDSYIRSCGTQHIKFGVYRPSKATIKHPQSLKKINKTSVIQFDDIKFLRK